MSNHAKYKIEVYEGHVEISGTLTIREAFDFLNFYEREGYDSLEDYGDGTCLYIRKRNIEEEDRLAKDEKIQEIKEELHLNQDLYKDKCNQYETAVNTILDLEGLVLKLNEDWQQERTNLKTKIEYLQKIITLDKLRESETIQNFMRKENDDTTQRAHTDNLSKGESFGPCFT